MAIIRMQSVTKQFGPRIVLDDVDLELNDGETVGLVGVNGAGKTTVFRLITGEFPPDLGTVTRARGVNIGFLKQEPDLRLDRTLHEEVGSVFAELLELERKLHDLSERMAERHDGPEFAELAETYDRVNAQFIAAGGHSFETRLHEILGGLGFSPTDYSLPMSVLSGGQKCRAALAKLLLRDADFLLLDEPTNHLDIDAVRWLEKFLAGHRGGCVVISHDRYLLDRLCDRIVEVSRRKLHGFSGNYSTYVQTREVQALTRQRQYEKDSAFIQKERDFIARHIAGQRTKEAQGRRTRLERRLQAGEFVTEALTTQRRAKLSFDGRQGREGAEALRCDELTMFFDERVLFTDLGFQIYSGDRFGITGPNGTGKSTLLKILLGLMPPRNGTAAWDRKLRKGYYAQEPTALDPNRTVVDEIRSAGPELSEERARSILGRYLFTGDDVFKRLGDLSGGEQSRVRLASLILSEPDVLVLDEPTNHLDIPSREALEESLSEFPGTIIVVSHDRYFLDRIVERLLVIRPTGHALYPGNYTYYIEQAERQKAASREAAESVKAKSSGEFRRESRRPSSEYDRWSFEEIEQAIVQRETELASLNERFGDPSLYRDGTALAALQERIQTVKRELAELEVAWQERAEEHG